MSRAVLIVCLLVLAAPAAGQRTIDRAAYQDRLRAMWLGECIANWTGLRTEGHRAEPPFYTDADWGTTPPGAIFPIEFVLHPDPWRADDDTDIEYVYLHRMTQAGRTLLSAEEIRDAWVAHMNPQYIWVSNFRAWELMGRNIAPPATSFEVINPWCYAIDAQLTTEFFGALAPSLPDRALRFAELPIRTTAKGHAVHASQFYMLLYCLALEVDPSLSGRDRALWLCREARRWLPPTSKAAAAVDLVLADFLANPDVNDWERTRDLIFTHFQQNAQANGYLYRGWTESSVNFACGVMALLYGQCDYRRTVQIGTLSGWDSDNCTATLGGLLGLMLGTTQLRAQFPGHQLSDRYLISATRNNMPDHLPLDPGAEDSFTLMAARMMPLIDATVVAAGGVVDTTNNRWLLPAQVLIKPAVGVPGWQEQFRSANFRILCAGGTVQPSSSIYGPVYPLEVHGSPNPWYFANAFEQDFTGTEHWGGRQYFFTTRGGPVPAGSTISLTVSYDRPVEVWSVRFIEGDHFPVGGWFEEIAVQIRINGQWLPVSCSANEPLDPARPFQSIDLVLPGPVQATEIRIIGPPGGQERFVTCLELDAVTRPVPIPAPAVQRPR
jgi:hypothetical protein